MLVLALALSAPLAAAGEFDLEFERFQLDNGLDVVLLPDHSTPIVHVEVWYHVGSKDEVAGRTGFAHLFEHLMFQGSANSPGEYFTPIQGVGGDLNGTTNADRTNYYETVPARYLPLALFMESDRMGHLLDVLDQGKLDNQRDVVKNERRQRYENPPYGRAFADLQGALYPEGHPYHFPTIGSHADLEAASLDDVKTFFHTWYVPNNATLVVAGDFKSREARKLVEENFGWIPRGEEVRHHTERGTPPAADNILHQYQEVPDRKLWMAWMTPPAFADGDAALDLAANVLCGGKDSRLYELLVREEQVARDIDCGEYSRSIDSMFTVEATAAEGHTTDELIPYILDQLHHLATDRPPTADELRSAQAQYEVGFYGTLSSIHGRAGTASFYLDQLGVPDAFQRDLDRYRTVTPDAVVKAVTSHLLLPHVELHISPKADDPALAPPPPPEPPAPAVASPPAKAPKGGAR
jgi:zinc protease